MSLDHHDVHDPSPSGIGIIDDRSSVKAVHSAFKRWRKKKRLSAEAETAAARVECGLWAAANNRTVSSVMLVGFAEDVAALEAAMGRE